MGALTNSTARTLTVSLDFLDKGKWKIRWWHDAADSGENAEHISTEERVIKNGDKLDLKLAPAGGAVIHFRPE